MAEMIRFGDFASFKYGKMPNKKKVTECGSYPVYSGYRYVGFYDEYNTEANQLIIVARGVGGTGDVKLTKERCYLTNLSIAADIDTVADYNFGFETGNGSFAVYSRTKGNM